MQREKSKGGSGDDATDERVNDFMRKASDFWSTASEEVGQTWGELLRSGERKDINKKIGHPQDTTDGDTEYTGEVAIMVIDESENLTAWERMQKRLTDAPLIQGKYKYIITLLFVLFYHGRGEENKRVQIIPRKKHTRQIQNHALPYR